MNDAELQILADEIETDPLARGYSGMTNAQIADSLNTVVDQSVDVETVDGWQLWAATTVADWNNLTAANRQFWAALLSQQSISVKDAKVRQNFSDLFPNATFPTTRANGIALQTKLVSQSVKLNLPPVREGDVEQAKGLISGE